MTTSIRCYDYVNQPYERVCDALRMNSKAVFQNATTAAESRAHGIAAGLHLNVAGFEIGKNIAITIKNYLEVEHSENGLKLTVNFEWKALDRPNLFPVMIAKLDVIPIAKDETQLDFLGEYSPPLGVVGWAIDAAIGHRIAEASVHQFVTEVASYLRSNIPPISDEPATPKK